MSMRDGPYRSFRFSTRCLSPSQGLTAYREMLERSIGAHDVDTEESSRFAFAATCFTAPGLGIAHIASGAVCVKRTGAMPADANDLVLAVVHQGTAAARRRDREVTLKGRGAFLSLSHEPLVMQRTSARLTNYALCRSDLAPEIVNLDRVLMRPIPVDTEAMALLGGYSRMAFTDGGPLSPEAARLAVRHLHDLIALALGPTRDAAEIASKRGLRAARRTELYARACRLIALSLDDPQLAPGAVAHRLGVSLRLLQKVFAERGETVMTRLWSERISRAARLLSSPEAADRSVTDIAFACGFNDSSHFGRVFASHRGSTPSQWRARGRETTESR
jgi:AraC-like DNA-binding protein